MTIKKDLVEKFEFYNSQNLKIPILIDYAIIPINSNFLVYDFSNHCFTKNDIDLLFPISKAPDFFKKFADFCQIFLKNI